MDRLLLAASTSFAALTLITFLADRQNRWFKPFSVFSLLSIYLLILGL